VNTHFGLREPERDDCPVVRGAAFHSRQVRFTLVQSGSADWMGGCVPNWKKAGKAWATGGASLAYDKIKDKRTAQEDEAGDAEDHAPEVEEQALPTAEATTPVAPQPPSTAEPETDPDGDEVPNRALLHKKANEALEQNLAHGEEIQVIIVGTSNQAIIGTDRRAFIFKKGLVAGATFGSEMTSWDYRNLVGVQLHTGMATGAVVLQGPGQSGKRTNYWAQGDDAPHKAPNAIPLARRHFKAAHDGTAKLRQLIDAVHHPSQHHTPSPAATSSIADELTKLASLRDAGALSEEEFAQLKAGLLAKGG
jgi:hypothetical protein